MSDALVERARMLLEAGRPREARALIRRRLAEEPDDLEALGVAAWAAELEDKHAEALRLVARPLAADPDDLTLLGVLAWARAGSGDVAGARAAAIRRCALSPGNWAALCDLAGVDLRAGRHDAETLGIAAEAVRLAPDEPSARLRLGSVHLARGDDAEAKREFREALRLDPESVEAQHDLAVADLRHGGLLRAAREFARLSTRPEVVGSAVRNLAIAAIRGLWVVQLVLVGLALIAGSYSRTSLISNLLPIGMARPLFAVGAIAVVVLVVIVVWRRLGRIGAGIFVLLRRTAPLAVALAADLLFCAVLLVLPSFDTTGRLDILYSVATAAGVLSFVLSAFATSSLRGDRG